MQCDCASTNSELKLYDFAYKTVIVDIVCSRQIQQGSILTKYSVSE